MVQDSELQVGQNIHISIQQIAVQHSTIQYSAVQNILESYCTSPDRASLEGEAETCKGVCLTSYSVARAISVDTSANPIAHLAPYRQVRVTKIRG